MAQSDVSRAVEQLLKTCKTRLEPDEYVLVQSHQDLFIKQEITKADIVISASVETLISLGFPFGTIMALKKAFPAVTAGGLLQNVHENPRSGSSECHSL